jgi:hypothetical protein
MSRHTYAQLETLETRCMLSVSNLAITAITSPIDLDNGIADHVTIPDGSTLTVAFDYSSSGGSTQATANIPSLGAASSSATYNNESTGYHYRSLDLTIPTGTKPGDYNLHLQVHNGTGSRATENDSEVGAIDVVLAVTVKATTITQVSGTGTVGGTATIAATLTDASGPVAGKTITFTLNGASFANNTATTNSNGVASLTNVSLADLGAGTATLCASFAGDLPYGPSYGQGELLINKAQPTVITAPSTNRPIGSVICDTAHLANGCNPQGTITFNLYCAGTKVDSETVNVTGSGDYTTPTGFTPTAAGQYCWEAIYSGDANNLQACDTEPVTICQVQPTISTTGQSVTYGEAVHSHASLSGLVPGVPLNPADTITYTLYDHAGNVVATDTEYVGSDSQDIVLPVGQYAYTATFNGDSNYTSRTTSCAPVCVAPAPLTITAGNIAKIYGQTINFTGREFLVDGLVNGDSIDSVQLASDGEVATAQADVYDINPSNSTGANLSNYNITYVTGNLTVNRAPLTVTVNPATKVYGQENPAFTSTITGLVNGDTDTPTYSTTATVGSPVGSYSILAHLVDSNNYNITYVAGSLTVDKAPLTITVNSATKVYGQDNPAFTGTITGLVNGDTNVPTFSTTATTWSPVGNYSIVAHLADPNYSIILSDGTLSITRAPLTITANSVTKVYGQYNPPLTLTVTGILNGDNVGWYGTPVTYANASSPVGEYAITVAPGGQFNPNYAYNYVQGTLFITPAQLTVTADNASKVQGSANPVFTGRITGLVNGDQITPTFSTAATINSGPGSYSIIPTVNAGPNYKVTTQNGVLTVTPASVVPPTPAQVPAPAAVSDPVVYVDTHHAAVSYGGGVLMLGPRQVVVRGPHGKLITTTVVAKQHLTIVTNPGHRVTQVDPGTKMVVSYGSKQANLVRSVLAKVSVHPVVKAIRACVRPVARVCARPARPIARHR